MKTIKEHLDRASTHQENESPFLTSEEFVPVQEEGNGSVTIASNIRTPFASIYEWPGNENMMSEEDLEVSRFVTSLYDEEFDSAVYQIMEEASQLISEYGENQEVTAEHLLNEHFDSLATETEAAMDFIAEHAEQLEQETITESELEAMVNDWRVGRTPLTPGQQEYFWGWAKKAVKWAKKKVKAVGKWALKKALRKLKRLVRPVLKQVLKKAINWLPSALRPIARRLAKKILKKVSEAEFEDPEYENLSEVGAIQHELDLQLAHLLYSEDEEEQDAAVSEFMLEANQGPEDAVVRLQSARERFIQEISELEDEADVEPAVERFIPALLPALKLGLKLIGRRKVVNFIAKYVAKFIKRFVGRKYAKRLSRAIVDAGLRLIHLETNEADELEAAASAVAGVVEDTVREAAGLPEHILEDEALLEGFLLEAFEKAAAANLPQVLPESVYEDRPELRETSHRKGAWVMLPKGKRKRFKKYTKVIDVVITPHAAKMIKTHGKRSLSTYFQEKLKLPAGKIVKARLHLFEAMVGTRLSDISRNDPSLSSHLPVGREYEHLHPLTPEAAAMLLNEPGLGREYQEAYHSDRTPGNDGGRRVYFIETEDVPYLAGKKQLPRLSEARLTFDFPANEVKIFAFLNEGRAQEIARKIRRQEPPGQILNTVSSVMRSLIDEALSCKVHRHTRVLHASLAPEAMIGNGLGRLPANMRTKLPVTITEWVGRGLKNFFSENAQDFVSATEDEADGVTMLMTISDPPGLVNLRKMIAGASTQFSRNGIHGQVQVNVKVIAGFYYE
ncbi:MAG: hypothetical protein ACE5HS_09310 [bacterium]